MKTTTQKISSILSKAGIQKISSSAGQWITGAYHVSWDYSMYNEFDYKYNYKYSHTHRNFKKKVFTWNIVLDLQNNKEVIKDLLKDFDNIVFLNA